MNYLILQVMSGRGAEAAREYRVSSRAAHPALVRALALFPEVPRSGAHTLVLQLVTGTPLLEWVAANEDLYTQELVASQTKQLLSALDWLHNMHIAHLDIRVS